MSKHLFNYCAIDWYENELKKIGISIPQIIEDMQLDGIEQFVYELDDKSSSYKDVTVGVHLNYWPYWMDFWLKKSQAFKTAISYN